MKITKCTTAVENVSHTGQWQQPFDEFLTSMSDFHVNDSSKVQVEMMYSMKFYRTYLDTNMQAGVIILPYEGNTSMMVVLPDKGKMKDVERNINRNSIKHWQDHATLK